MSDYERLKQISYLLHTGVITIGSAILQYGDSFRKCTAALSIVGPGWLELRADDLSRRAFEYSNNIQLEEDSHDNIIVRVSDLCVLLKLRHRGAPIGLGSELLNHLDSYMAMAEVRGLLGLIERIGASVWTIEFEGMFRKVLRTFPATDGGFYMEQDCSFPFNMYDVQHVPPREHFVAEMSHNAFTLRGSNSPELRLRVKDISERKLRRVIRNGTDMVTTALWLCNKLNIN